MKMICPHCGVKGSADASLLGTKVKCPKCLGVFRFTPSESDSSSPVASDPGQMEPIAGSTDRLVTDQEVDDVFNDLLKKSGDGVADGVTEIEDDAEIDRILMGQAEASPSTTEDGLLSDIENETLTVIEDFPEEVLDEEEATTPEEDEIVAALNAFDDSEPEAFEESNIAEWSDETVAALSEDTSVQDDELGAVGESEEVLDFADEFEMDESDKSDVDIFASDTPSPTDEDDDFFELDEEVAADELAISDDIDDQEDSETELTEDDIEEALGQFGEESAGLDSVAQALDEMQMDSEDVVSDDDMVAEVTEADLEESEEVAEADLAEPEEVADIFGMEEEITIDDDDLIEVDEEFTEDSEIDLEDDIENPEDEVDTAIASHFIQKCSACSEYVDPDKFYKHEDHIYCAKCVPPGAIAYEEPVVTGTTTGLTSEKDETWDFDGEDIFGTLEGEEENIKPATPKAETPSDDEIDDLDDDGVETIGSLLDDDGGEEAGLDTGLEPMEAAHHTPGKFTVSTLIKDAYHYSKGAKGAILGGFIISFLIYLIISVAGEFFLPQILVQQGMVTSILIGACFQLILGLVSFILTAGLLNMAVCQIGQRSFSWKTVFSGFRRFGSFSGLFFLQALMVSIGMLLFVLPGIYLAVGYVLAIPLIFMKNLSPWQALETSRIAVHKRWWTVFFSMIAITLLTVVSAIPLGIGLIWTIPMLYVLIGVLYYHFFGADD